MATAVERANSRSFNGLTGRIGYLVTGAATESAAWTAILAAAPSTMNGLALRFPEATIVDDSIGTWTGEATYGTVGGAKVLKPGETTLTGTPDGGFQIRKCLATLPGSFVLQCLQATAFGRTTHMTHGLELIASYANTDAGETAPDFGGAIGVTERGNVEGVDVPPGALNSSDVTLTVDRTTFAIGKDHALFKGFQFSNRQDGAWECTWSFAYSLGRVGMAIDGITGIDMPPWSYLWSYFVEHEDATSKRITRRAIGVYVHRVYDEINFTALGTGCIR